MRLYYAAGVYVGTQADAKRLAKDFAQVEVPTDKDGLLAFLNRSHIAALAKVVGPPEEDDGLDFLAPEPEAPPPVKPIDHNAQCNVEEAIQNATPTQLASYASNVCWRIQELAK